MTIKNIILLAITTLICSLSCAFIGHDNTENTPGIIQFIGDAGSPNVFTFKRWQFTQVEMAEDKIENIQLQLEINTSSLETGWKKLEKSIRKKEDYFYVKKFPKATVKIKGASANEDGSYSTDAQLTLKGITQKVPLTFTISAEKPYTVKGQGVIQRRAFNFTDEGPKEEVPVNFEVELPL